MSIWAAFRRWKRRRDLQHRWRIVESWSNRCTVDGEPVGFVVTIGEENFLGKRRIRMMHSPEGDWTGGGAWRAACQWVSEPELSGEGLAVLRKVDP